jgi:hypothetical protein
MKEKEKKSQKMNYFDLLRTLPPDFRGFQLFCKAPPNNSLITVVPEQNLLLYQMCYEIKIILVSPLHYRNKIWSYL